MSFIRKMKWFIATKSSNSVDVIREKYFLYEVMEISKYTVLAQLDPGVYFGLRCTYIDSGVKPGHETLYVLFTDNIPGACLGLALGRLLNIC